jgi:hypothetical protein
MPDSVVKDPERPKAPLSRATAQRDEGFEKSRRLRAGSRTRERLSRARSELDARPKVWQRTECPWTAQQAGGADRNRTDDLRLARAALSQLSYSPEVGPSGGPR